MQFEMHAKCQGRLPKMCERVCVCVRVWEKRKKLNCKLFKSCAADKSEKQQQQQQLENCCVQTAHVAA